MSVPSQSERALGLARAIVILARDGSELSKLATELRDLLAGRDLYVDLPGEAEVCNCPLGYKRGHCPDCDAPARLAIGGDDRPLTPYLATECPRCGRAKQAQTDCRSCGYVSPNEQRTPQARTIDSGSITDQEQE